METRSVCKSSVTLQPYSHHPNSSCLTSAEHTGVINGKPLMATAVSRIWQLPNMLQLSRTRDKLRPCLRQEMDGKSLQRLRKQTICWGQKTGLSIILCPGYSDPVMQLEAVQRHFSLAKKYTGTTSRSPPFSREERRKPRFPRYIK